MSNCVNKWRKVICTNDQIAMLSNTLRELLVESLSFCSALRVSHIPVMTTPAFLFFLYYLSTFHEFFSTIYFYNCGRFVFPTCTITFSTCGSDMSNYNGISEPDDKQTHSEDAPFNVSTIVSLPRTQETVITHLSENRFTSHLCVCDLTAVCDPLLVFSRPKNNDYIAVHDPLPLFFVCICDVWSLNTSRVQSIAVNTG